MLLPVTAGDFPEGVEVTVRPLKQEFLQGEPIVGVAKLENHSKEPVWYAIPPGFPRTLKPVKKTPGLVLPKEIQRMTIGGGPRLRLGPMRYEEERFYPYSQFRITKPGTYRFECGDDMIFFEEVGGGPGPLKFAATGPLSFTVKVVPATPVELQKQFDALAAKALELPSHNYTELDPVLVTLSQYPPAAFGAQLDELATRLEGDAAERLQAYIDSARAMDQWFETAARE